MHSFLTLARAAAGGAARGLLDVLYPPRCLACEARLGLGSVALCAACVTGVERAQLEPLRARLAALPAGAAAFDSAFALWRFAPDGALRAFQHALKYGNRPRYGYAAGGWLGGALREVLPAEEGASAVDAVVPVPLHRVRLLERGYNQSAQLARGVAGQLEVPCRPDWLARPRPTRSQTRLSRRARWANVAGAFRAPCGLEGQRLVVVDDVLTTGATAVAAAQTLREAGACAVHLATLAMAS